MEKTVGATESNAGHVTDDTRLEPNEAEVAAKAYDDEVVFMHLSTGVYASIEQCGAIVWDAIGKRYSVCEIADVLSTHYDVGRAQALGDARVLAAQLLGERMVCQSAESGRSAVIDAPATRQPYAAPCLVVYRDMEDLLALDPPLPQYAEAPWTKS